MLNIKNNNQKFWIITMIFALMLVLILEQRSNNKALNTIQDILIIICKKNDLDNRRLLNFLSMPSDKIVDLGDAKFYVP